MNYNLIAQIVAFLSLAGMIGIVLKKIPVLVSLPEEEERKEKKRLIPVLKEKIKKYNPFKKVSFDILLQKILYKFRILTLKADNKTFKILQDLKKKALERKKRMEDNYWEEIKKKMLK